MMNIRKTSDKGEGISMEQKEMPKEKQKEQTQKEQRQKDQKQNEEEQAGKQSKKQNKKQKKRRKKWIKFRHSVFRNILYVLIAPYTRIKYGVKIDRFRKQDGRQYLIIMNHQTAFDQFFVGIAFSGPVYYLATEDLFSNGWVSKVIEYLVAPIPIKKQTTDLQAVATCSRVAREGGTIALAPEGNRTYSGQTGYIKPSIAKLVRVLKLPVAVFKIEGGYGVQPRWSDVVRRGRMHAYVSKVIEPEEIKKLTDDELYDLIQEELYVDEACVDGFFYHKKNAEYLERAMYVCPYCGLSEFESHNDRISCKKCNREIKYLPTKELEGVGFDFLYRFVSEWYTYQCDFMNKLDYTQYVNEPMYVDTVCLSEVILYKNKKLLQKETRMCLYGDRIVIGNEEEPLLYMDFDKVEVVTVLGRNKLNVYFEGTVYQMKGNKHFNALKYVNMFYRYKNVKEDNENGKFLGI